MHRFLSLMVVVLAAGAVLATTYAWAGCGCNGAPATAYNVQTGPTTAAMPRANTRQYSYAPGAAVAAPAPVARTYAPRSFRSYSYVPTAGPGDAYAGPIRPVRGAASKANFNYAPWQGPGAPPR